MNELAEKIIWPPVYRIKKHRRARHVKLRANKADGLVITVPYRFNERELPDILEMHKTWILLQLSKLKVHEDVGLPIDIQFQALHEHWRVTYIPCKAKLELFERPEKELVLLGKIENEAKCKVMLLNWMKDCAKLFLPDELAKVSRIMQLSYQAVTIRDQNTLWGSCTSAKCISLNYKLIFLPTHLMRHIMIHELAHTLYLNHSPKFWQVVEKYDPDYLQHKRELRRADQFIPNWI